MADVKRRLEGWRPTEQEWEQIADEALDHITPKETEEVELLSFHELYDEAKEIADMGNKFAGLSTGYPDLDQMTLGLNGGDLVVIYGYTSMGKSQLGQNICLNVGKSGIPVLIIGLELTNKQNAARLIRMGGSNRGLPFLFPKKQDLSYQEIQPAIKRAKQDGCGLVMVDQLQDLIHSTTNEQGEIGQIMAELKRAAISNEVPILVMSHVNREGAQPGPPPLSVLKGSASIEQKADMALAVYQDEDAEEGEAGYKEMQIANRKNRQKGKEFKYARLKITEGMRLVDPSPITML